MKEKKRKKKEKKNGRKNDDDDAFGNDDYSEEANEKENGEEDPTSKEDELLARPVLPALQALPRQASVGDSTLSAKPALGPCAKCQFRNQTKCAIF